MRVFVLFAVLFAVCAGPALAQDAPDAARQRQLDLAGRYLQLTQGADMLKVLREQIEQGYGDAELPDDQRAWLTDQMTAMFEDVLEIAIAEARDDVADSFTATELQAAVAFYETPMGRSIARKQIEMGVVMQEAMMPALMSRVGALGEKFCQRFDCAEAGEAAAKSGR